MKPTILVIDDELIIRIFLEKTLSKDFNIVALSSGPAGWEWMMEGNKPDLIITDMFMPGMTGCELVHLIKESEAFHNIPVIMLSANQENENEESCVTKSADEYVQKPIKAPILFDIISKYLKTNN
jgi:two-component system, chemotaxis family, chemotaxis protein CheY